MKKYLLLVGIPVLFLSEAKVISQTFTSSNLPIVVINTHGQQIDSAWYYVIASMGIIDNGPGNRNNLGDPYNNYNGKVQIRLQGSSSILWPKKSYRITTINAFNQAIDASLLGMPAHEDWVLKALYQDKSLLRDDLGYKIFNQMGHYSSRSRFFEMVVDGNYRGIYQLLEKVKKDKNRVNISKLKPTDTFGDDLTGGYIISLDKFVNGDPGWYSKYKSNVSHDSANFFLYYYPKADSMPQIQKDYIKNYFDKFEDALASPGYSNPVTGYRKYIDVPSFVDNFIINELSRNVDGYRASTFFYKDKESSGNGKLRAAPVWDFNIAFGNCSYLGGNDPYWWQYQQYPLVNFVPFWWWQFMSDSSFKNDLKCRYKRLRENVLNENNLYSYIDNMASYLNEAQQRNFSRWPILGQEVYPNPTPVPNTYAGEISYLKFWLHERLVWLDNYLPGPCVVNLTEKTNPNSTFKIFPNPASGFINVSYHLTETTSVNIELLNIPGQQLLKTIQYTRAPGLHNEEIDLSLLPPGSYFLRLNLNGAVYHRKLIKLAE